MKFNFKIQQYQTDAVNAVTTVFNGQGNYANAIYTRDLGRKVVPKQNDNFSFDDLIEEDSSGYRNRDVILSEDELLNNIKRVQNANNIKESTELSKGLGACSLDIEMETGTGKTYVYIKTMFELNKLYGWSKFIVVVPSIAIREGVKKSFEMTTDHFMECYGKKARFFIYNSSNLQQLDSFSSSADINVMIINTQAFATSLKEGAKNKESRIIYSKRDEFQSRRPIDVISANRPILIIDEPQKMGGKESVTQKALQNFKPLFALNYSATHKEQHNKVYVLDALEAYNQKLVKKIEVKGFSFKNFRGTDGYLYLERIVLDKNKKPRANIELEINYNKSINRETRLLSVDDNLYFTSKEMNQYKGYIISDIDGESGTVTFTNGLVLHVGEATGDVSEETKRRTQIRETILSHIEKEEKLFDKGIKCLSLFFIDEVAKYRQYDEEGNEVLGEYGKMFEEEYISVLNEKRTLFDTPYQRYLAETLDNVSSIHRGYFSIDKKTGRSIDSEVKRGNDFSDDISAYDLIMKNKERLLSFEEPTRFIFSHSALREGWDNPNIFQICTLKHSNSDVGKRQEVGRGLRLCVNSDGNRMDVATCGSDVHKINLLTVVATESYEDFVKDLQKDIKDVLYERPKFATEDYFKGKYITKGDEQIVIDDSLARNIVFYLAVNRYIDKDGKIEKEYRQAVNAGTLAPLTDDLAGYDESVHKLVRSIYDESVVNSMIGNARDTKIHDNPLNDNFNKQKFQELWKRINHKYSYMVSFNSDELIKKSIDAINQNLSVTSLTYTTTIGAQKDVMKEGELERGESFVSKSLGTKTIKHKSKNQIKYDLIGEIAKGTTLTRKTVANILKGLEQVKLYMFTTNPEEFITKVTRLIDEQKANTIVEHISYNQIEGEYDSTIFTDSFSDLQLGRAYKANNAIQDYVLVDGMSENCVEKQFVDSLDKSAEVEVYAKLPKGFHIPTPVGDYSPDWAIAFKDGMGIKHIYFIAETKGSLESLELRGIEKAKTDCARKLFNEISTENIHYDIVKDYDSLINKVMN